MPELVSYLGHQWRELQFAQSISGVNWRSAVPGGHPLIMTNCIAGAERRTTCEGVHVDGSVTGNVNLGAIYNSATKFAIGMWFKFDQGFSSATAANQFLWGKFEDGTNILEAYFNQTDGKLHFYYIDGGAIKFVIVSAEDSWAAGEWHFAIFSISDANAVRMIIDGGTPVTDVDVSAGPDAGDLVIGDADDPGAGTGFRGVIKTVFIGSNTSSGDLTANEEQDLYAGCPPADIDGCYKFNEGQESTVYDEGAGGHDGTLDSGASWAWGGTRQPVASFAGIDQYAVSSDGVNILGDLSVVLFIKSKWNVNESNTDRQLLTLHIDNSNQLAFIGDGAITNDIRWHVNGAGGTGVVKNCDQVGNLAIDEYAIIIGTLQAATGNCVLYINGAFEASQSGAGQLVDDGTGAQIFVGCEDTPAYFNPSEVLMWGLIDGVINPIESRVLSRNLNYRFNTGILMR